MAADGLRVRQWGSGDRVAVLVHGITSDSGSWWRVGPELAERGYRVLAPELTGHGLSAHADGYSPGAWADALAAAVPVGPELLLGHSLGGLVAALAVDRIRPERAVYEDPAWTLTGDGSVVETFRAHKTWTPEQVRAAYPRWAPQAVEAKYAALRRWDAETVRAFAGFQHFVPERATAPSLVLAADPSTLIPPTRVAALVADGFEVRTVPGAGHIIHNDDFDGFIKALDGWI